MQKDLDKRKKEITLKIRQFVKSYGSVRKFSEATGISPHTAKGWNAGARYPGGVMSKKLEILSKGELKAHEICIYENR